MNTNNKQKTKSTKTKIPETLEECFETLEKQLPPDQIGLLKNMTERELIRCHFGIGMWMRNNWGLWHNSKLYQNLNKIYFEKTWKRWVKEGHFKKEDKKTLKQWLRCHPDSMSSYIIKTFHRHLNGKSYKDIEILG